jgi:hypothetical protein
MAFSAPIIPVVVELRQQELSLREVARELYRRGIPSDPCGWGYETPNGRVPSLWSEAQVRRLLRRAGRDTFAAGKIAPGATPAGTVDLASGPDGQ